MPFLLCQYETNEPATLETYGHWTEMQATQCSCGREQDIVSLTVLQVVNQPHRSTSSLTHSLKATTTSSPGPSHKAKTKLMKRGLTNSRKVSKNSLPIRRPTRAVS